MTQKYRKTERQRADREREKEERQSCQSETKYGQERKATRVVQKEITHRDTKHWERDRNNVGKTDKIKFETG